MSERLAEISARIDGVRKLGSVMRAMRGMAAARAHQAEAELTAVDAYESTIRAALARTLALIADPLDSGDGPGTLVVFLAEQGFAGAFSERVLDRLPEGPRLCIVGTRGMSIATERGLNVWKHLPLPSHGPAIPRFAGELARDLLVSGSRRIDALYTVAEIGGSGATIERHRLFPQETSPADHAGPPPLLTLPPPELLERLLGEALHAGLCRAALHALAAENAARMLAMAAAETHTQAKLAELEARERQVRQEAITDEIIELAAGEAAFRSSLKRSDADRHRSESPSP